MVIEETTKIARDWSTGGNREGHLNFRTKCMTGIPFGALRNGNPMKLEQRWIEIGHCCGIFSGFLGLT